MSKAYVIMTALPFTKGHEDIIRFATGFSNDVRVLFTPAPGEPHISKRAYAIANFCNEFDGRVKFDMILNEHSEDPESEGFWAYWRYQYRLKGFTRGDYIVGGDPYILKLAEELGGTPIYLTRGNETHNWRATSVRQSPVQHFSRMAKEMQDAYRKRITIFGAESVGKTTLVQNLGALEPGGTTFPEFARPYLIQNGSELTREKFLDIIAGQVGQKKLMDAHPDIPFTFWDTDLLSTIGYLRLNPALDPHGGLEEYIKSIIEWPGYLSDKYFILSQAEILFEEDPLRYGGDKRESDDQFWMDLCDEFGVSWDYISTSDLTERRNIVLSYAYEELTELMDYTRPFN